MSNLESSGKLVAGRGPARLPGARQADAPPSASNCGPSEWAGADAKLILIRLIIAIWHINKITMIEAGFCLFRPRRQGERTLAGLSRWV